MNSSPSPHAKPSVSIAGRMRVSSISCLLTAASVFVVAATLISCDLPSEMKPAVTPDSQKFPSFVVDMEKEELVYRTIPGGKLADSPSFVLQQGVPVKVLVGAGGAPAAAVTLVSPTGVETPLANMADKLEGFTGFLSQHEFTPAQTGQWSVRVAGAEGKQYGVVVARKRSPSVAMDAGLEKDVVGSGEAAKLFAYLYDPQQEETATVPLSKTVQYNTLEVQAIVMQPDGSLETVDLHDDGADGDEQADDGIYTASYTPKVEEGQLPVLIYSVRDGHTQLTRNITQLTVTAAAASRLQEVSSKPLAEKGKFSALGDVRFGVTANVAKAGKYFIIADIANKSGALVRTVYSAREQVSAPGAQEFTVTLTRDYMARQGVALPLSVKSARLYVVNGDDENRLDKKEFNEPIPYEDAGEFEEKKLQFQGVQWMELKDTDGDGKNDKLLVKYRFIAPVGGSYDIQASIGGASSGVVQWHHSSVRDAGAHDVEMAFDVHLLRASGLSAFYLRNIAVAGAVQGMDMKSYPLLIGDAGAYVPNDSDASPPLDVKALAEPVPNAAPQ